MKDESDQPWGRLSGVLAAAGAMLIGVLRDLNPDTILLRAAIAGTVVGAVVGLLSRLMQRMAEDE